MAAEGMHRRPAQQADRSPAPGGAAPQSTQMRISGGTGVHVVEADGSLQLEFPPSSAMILVEKSTASGLDI